MTEKRDYLGAYEGGPNIGATTTERNSAGATHPDTQLSAAMKVGEPSAQPVVFSAGKPLWLQAFSAMVVVLTLLVLIGAAYYVAERWVNVGPIAQEVRTEKKLSSPGSSALVREFRQLEIDRLKPLFRADAPLDGIFGGCRSRDCY